MWNAIKKFFKKSSEPEFGSKEWAKQEARRLVESVSEEDLRRMMRKAWDETLGKDPRYKYLEV